MYIKCDVCGYEVDAKEYHRNQQCPKEHCEGLMKESK